MSAGCRSSGTRAGPRASGSHEGTVGRGSSLGPCADAGERNAGSDSGRARPGAGEIAIAPATAPSPREAPASPGGVSAAYRGPWAEPASWCRVSDRGVVAPVRVDGAEPPARPRGAARLSARATASELDGAFARIAGALVPVDVTGRPTPAVTCSSWADASAVAVSTLAAVSVTAATVLATVVAAFPAVFVAVAAGTAGSASAAASATPTTVPVAVSAVATAGAGVGGDTATTGAAGTGGGAGAGTGTAVTGGAAGNVGAGATGADGGGGATGGDVTAGAVGADTATGVVVASTAVAGLAVPSATPATSVTTISVRSPQLLLQRAAVCIATRSCASIVTHKRGRFRFSRKLRRFSRLFGAHRTWHDRPVEVSEVAAGLWRWTAPHPEWQDGDDWERDVGCVYYEAPAATVLIDPLVPSERDRFFEALDRDVERRGLPVAVLLTVPWHARSAAELVERYAATDEAPAGVEPFALPAFDEVVWWLPDVAALIVGDSLFGVDGALALCPETWVSGERRETLRNSLRPLLERPIERILVSHGAPVLADGSAALARALG